MVSKLWPRGPDVALSLPFSGPWGTIPPTNTIDGATDSIDSIQTNDRALFVPTDAGTFSIPTGHSPDPLKSEVQ